MIKSKGWTFIELVIVILLLSVLGAFALSPKTSFNWQEQRFIQAWLQALNQAKEYAYFRNSPVRVELQEDAFVFLFSQSELLLRLDKPDFVKVDDKAFPLLVSFEPASTAIKGEGWVEIALALKTIRIDRQTLYAYVHNKS